jgi:hypothetical protein
VEEELEKVHKKMVRHENKTREKSKKIFENFIFKRQVERELNSKISCCFLGGIHINVFS